MSVCIEVVVGLAVIEHTGIEVVVGLAVIEHTGHDIVISGGMVVGLVVQSHK